MSTDKRDLPTSSSPSGTPLSEGTRRELIAALQQNWQPEMEGVRTPIIPFFFLSSIPAIIVAAIISLMAHFVVGAAKTLVTGRSWFNSGMEMTVVGAIEAVIAYVLGAAFKAA